MASLPARQSHQQRGLPTERSQAPTSEARESRSQARSQSEDSQTIFVHKPEADAELQDIEPRPVQPPDEDELKRCWICMADESEDTPETSQWRDPCPCALVAHEDCLWDWITDLEATKNSRSTDWRGVRIECPQCKAEIKLSRPVDYLVEIVRGIEEMGNQAILPISGIALTSAMVQLSKAVGIHTIYTLFGAQDGNEILSPLWWIAVQSPAELYAREPAKVWAVLSDMFFERLSHWRLLFGIPLIAPVLVLSRTSLADPVLPVLPIIFFASQAHSPSDALDFATWPPSASFAYAILPYVRAIYNAYYKRVWSEKERQWLEAVKPRMSQQSEGDAARENRPNPPAEAEDILEVRIDHGVWGDDWEVEEEQLVQQAADRQPAAQPQAPLPVDALVGDVPQQAINAMQHDDGNPGQGEARQRHLPQEGGFPRDDAAPAPVVPDGRVVHPPGQQEDAQQAGAGAPQNAADAQHVERGRLVVSPTGIAGTFLGALFFPTIAGLSGEILKLVLPHAWTHASLFTRQGFFQKRWARSLVGGCLFVVCKDAIMLYVRWKAAQLHKQRRVVDVDRRHGRGSFRSR